MTKCTHILYLFLWLITATFVTHTSSDAAYYTPPPLGTELYTTYKTALQSGNSDSMRRVENESKRVCDPSDSTPPPWVWHQPGVTTPATQTCPLWAALSDVMREAYNAGDTNTLERIKASQPAGFGNLDDLGEPFSQYGSSMENWDQMIADATSKATQQAAE